MALISIETTQNVTIDYQLAGLGSRLLAYLIDLLILIAYSFLMFFLIMGLAGAGINNGTIMTFIYICLILLPVMFYDLVCELFFDGQSVGKRSLGLKVVTLDGTKPSLGSYALRWASRLLEGIVFFYGVIPVITIAVSEKAQRMGDMMAGTTVIRVNKKASILRNPLDLAKEIVDYQPTYPDAINLSDEDVRIIKGVIRNYKINKNREPVDAVTRKVEEILSIKCNEPPIHFLTKLIEDYNHLITRDI